VAAGVWLNYFLVVGEQELADTLVRELGRCAPDVHALVAHDPQEVKSLFQSHRPSHEISAAFVSANLEQEEVSDVAENILHGSAGNVTRIVVVGGDPAELKQVHAHSFIPSDHESLSLAVKYWSKVHLCNGD
jgi:hypothetical protein